jgi:hypothetical protein
MQNFNNSKLLAVVVLNLANCREVAKLSRLKVFVPQELLPLTARQYGEVVLPDAASGQGPGTLARKLSRCKEGMARVFAVMVGVRLSHTCFAVQV